MKHCTNCGAQLEDAAAFCPYCGAACSGQAAGGGQAPPQQTYQNAYQAMPYDHTAEFSPQDISENKVLCMVLYLMGAMGIIIAALAGSGSPYVAFHIRQALKFTVVDTLLLLAGSLLCWTVLIPIFCLVMIVVLFVIRIIAFVQICGGQAKEPAIIRSLDFLN